MIRTRVDAASKPSSDTFGNNILQFTPTISPTTSIVVGVTISKLNNMDQSSDVSDVSVVKSDKHASSTAKAPPSVPEGPSSTQAHPIGEPKAQDQKGELEKLKQPEQKTGKGRTSKPSKHKQAERSKPPSTPTNYDSNKKIDSSSINDSPSSDYSSSEPSESSSEDGAAKKKREAKTKARAKEKEARAKKIKKLEKKFKAKLKSWKEENEDSSSSDNFSHKKRKIKSKVKAEGSEKQSRVVTEKTTTESSDLTDESDLSQDAKKQKIKGRKLAKVAAEQAVEITTRKVNDRKKKAKCIKIEIREGDSDSGATVAEGLGIEPAAGETANTDDPDEEAKSKVKEKKGSKAEFKRINEVWNKKEYKTELKETMEDAKEGKFDSYAFTVRRKFDWDGKYSTTKVDIRSESLKKALKHVMDDCKDVSFEEETPAVNPGLIFLFLEELRTHMQELKVQSKAKTDKTFSKKKRSKARTSKKAAGLKAQHLKVLIDYIDEDYKETKKKLYPMLENKIITFDLLWALYRSNDIVYCETYSNSDEPRAFILDYNYKKDSVFKGEYYRIEGRYLEYDGKQFGMSDMMEDVDSFQGPRKISSLKCYPLKYHEDYDGIKELLVGRGRKFVSLRGMQYRFQKGMGFYKKNNQVMRVNINGRVMADPATFRRINPNYPVSTLKPDDKDLLSDSDESSESDEEGHDSEKEENELRDQFGENEEPKQRKKLIRDKEGRLRTVMVDVNENGNIVELTNFKELSQEDEEAEPIFTEKEYVVASPVLFGFSFSEKQWLEMSVSGMQEIDWDEDAFDSLVIPPPEKVIIKALVESHAHSARRNIDDVIQGKGRGLVAVLHGPPGTGKTLTAEAIAELLKRPLYMVAMGQLGQSPLLLEKSLDQILDVAHTWGALLLLDEADVFLEARDLHSMGRNALVSVFLRTLEYFQGIMFLTTNRVATFDQAFQSRIHLGIRYGELTIPAMKSVWKMFIEKVGAIKDVEVASFVEDDFVELARRPLNGRQIKNSVRTAQALATNESKPFSMSHIKTVLEVADRFNNDMKGPGYEAAKGFYS